MSNPISLRYILNGGIVSPSSKYPSSVIAVLSLFTESAAISSNAPVAFTLIPASINCCAVIPSIEGYISGRELSLPSKNTEPSRTPIASMFLLSRYGSSVFPGKSGSIKFLTAMLLGTSAPEGLLYFLGTLSVSMPFSIRILAPIRTLFLSDSLFIKT